MKRDLFRKLFLYLFLFEVPIFIIPNQEVYAALLKYLVEAIFVYLKQSNISDEIAACNLALSDQSFRS